MKKQTLFLITFVGALLLASGTIEAQVVIGGGGGGLSKVSESGGILAKLFPNEDLRKPCKNGAKRLFVEYDAATEQTNHIWRVCQNNRYFQRVSIDYSKVGCRDGARSIVQDHQGDQTVVRTYRCVKGKYLQTSPDDGN